MNPLAKIPSKESILSAYTSFAASALLFRTIANQLKSIANQFIPQNIRARFLTWLGGFVPTNKTPSTHYTYVLHEFKNNAENEVYQSAKTYLRTKINTPSVDRISLSKHQRDKVITEAAEFEDQIVDVFQGFEVKWKTVTVEKEKSSVVQHRLEFTFPKEHKHIVLDQYIPYIISKAKSVKEEEKVLRLYSLDIWKSYDDTGSWGSINMELPSKFDTLAMDPTLKKAIVDDLDRFVERKEFYRRVGKPWKRGYLLYGPPGTGKSSLIAAMANYLNFNIYDLELSRVGSGSQLRNLMLGTRDKSILVIEDIDCSIELKDRRNGGGASKNNRISLSSLLNAIDGLWSSCGDERIIVFTTNYKDRLDPALLRPGRMDMHIHMTYCTPCGFKLLASNYLQIESHMLFEEIEKLMTEVNVTPAEVAEELMRCGDVESSLQGLVTLLETKKDKKDEVNVQDDADSEVKDDESNSNTDYESNSNCDDESDSGDFVLFG